MKKHLPKITLIFTLTFLGLAPSLFAANPNRQTTLATPIVHIFDAANTTLSCDVVNAGIDPVVLTTNVVTYVDSTPEFPFAQALTLPSNNKQRVDFSPGPTVTAAACLIIVTSGDASMVRGSLTVTVSGGLQQTVEAR